MGENWKSQISHFLRFAFAEVNGDANGAYNIARKGILILRAIKENSAKPDLYISKYQWNKFTQRYTPNNACVL